LVLFVSRQKEHGKKLWKEKLIW